MKIEKDIQFRGEIYKIEIDGCHYKIYTQDRSRYYEGCGIDITKEGIKSLILKMNNIPYDVYKYEEFMNWNGIIE